ncbi:MAG: DUF922 domain-containing Zn-dependent protease [Bacteroidota bacterium]|nr:DUF922 domain-containing Zn-dependent protease [Bacteroidota bacterium]MDX5447881.1 DUF922 domain-containing Zn-dependent protease [Bacteroidota bacterium]MDX5505287.1 DUF922 domain-containing Zn-dependent protease [Bacteroidota bacterium]
MLIMEPEVGPWWSGKGTYSVICQMNPDRSWADRSRRTWRLLRHEQLHFDIAEWHARMLRSQVSTEPVTEKEAIRAFDKIFEELEEIQDRYDRDTDHGLKPDVQKDWENRVQRELKKWERFSKSDCDWG